jgi:hypothetical protein
MHKESGAMFTIPPYRKTENVLEWHLVGARKLLDLFGITDERAFDAKVRSAG